MEKYTKEMCRISTFDHIEKVRNYMSSVAMALLNRARVHDQSKMEEPELSIFTEYTPKLKNCEYGSEEYKKNLDEMKVALDHHYSVNSHHPEYYKHYVCEWCGYRSEHKVEGYANDECPECRANWMKQEPDISQMDLFDLIEMICDWKAAVLRHPNGDIMDSLEKNIKRFKIEPQLANVLRYTILRFEEETTKF